MCSEIALAAWNEEAREPERQWVAGRLRLAAEHLAIDHAGTAERARGLAATIEDATEADRFDVIMQLSALHREILSLKAADRPEIAKRLARLGANAATVDIIIPLGHESPHENEELRLLLRSIEANALGLGRVIVATDCAPAWLHNVEIAPIGDAHQDCKDANLIDKVLGAIRFLNVEKFVFCADDNVFAQPVRLDSIPVLFNSHPRTHFNTGGTWHRRVIHTLDWAAGRGVQLEHHYDIHAPQYFSDAQELLRRMEGVDYTGGGGLTIMTAFRVVMGETANAMPQACWKETFEHHSDDTAAATDFARPLVGYNDAGFESCLRARLFAKFPHRSRFEA